MTARPRPGNGLVRVRDRGREYRRRYVVEEQHGARWEAVAAFIGQELATANARFLAARSVRGVREHPCPPLDLETVT